MVFDLVTVRLGHCCRWSEIRAGSQTQVGVPVQRGVGQRREAQSDVEYFRLAAERG